MTSVPPQRPSPVWLRRSSRLLLEFLAALVAGFIVLAGFAAWRLSGDQPVRLTFLTPYIEEALTPPDKSFSVTIDDTVLSWAGWKRSLDLRATGVRVRDSDGRTVAAVPGVSLTLSARALLLHGLVAPEAIEVFQPHIFLVRDADGRFRFVHAVEPEQTEPSDQTSPILPEVLEALSARRDPTSHAGYLTHLSLTHGALTFVDKKTGLTWRSPDSNIALTRDANGLGGRMDITVERLGNPARLAMAVHYDQPSQTLALDSRFTGVDASAVAQIDPVLARFAGAQITLDGRLSTTIGLDGRIGATSFDVSGGPGTLTMPDVFEAPLAMRRVSLRANFDPVADRLTVDQADLQFDGPRLSATGSFDGLHAGLGGSAADLTIAAKVTAENIDMAELAHYWPSQARPKARAWIVGHVTSGHVGRAESSVALRMPGGDTGATVVDEMTGTIVADGLTVHYLDPLPVVEDGVGKAHFTQKDFVAEFSGGHVQDIQIDGGTVDISHLDEHEQIIDIDGRLRGPLAAAVTLLDNPRLGYVKKLGLTAAGVRGTAKASLSFSFPAIHDLSFDQVKLTATADISDAHLDKAMLNQDIDNGDFKLNLDRHGMGVGGTASLGGAPITFQWDENFGKSDITRRITASGRTSAAQRAAFGFDYRPTLDGPVDTNVVFTRFAKKNATLDLKLGLADATLNLPVVHWQKPPGTPGDAHVTLEMAGDQVAAIPGFSLTAADTAITGRARFADDGSLSQVQFDELRIGRTDLQGVAVAMAGKRADIVVAGGTIDAGPLIKHDDKNPVVRDPPTPAFTFQAKHLDHILIDADNSLSEVSLILRHDDKYWDEIRLDATLPGNQPLTMRYVPDNGKHTLSITSANAGAMLSAFNVMDTMKNGRLSITGESDDQAPDRPLVGTAVIKEFRIVRAPVLAKLLTLATLTGFVDVLTGEGFQFDRFDSDFTKTNGRIAIKLARAHGPSIGLTGTGYLDFEAHDVDMAGTVVPAYALNGILGNIPVIGNLLQGGEGKGMFAATYKATGALDNPHISVNPLAALAPGFLRGMFEIFDSKSGDTTPPPATALPDPGSNK